MRGVVARGHQRLRVIPRRPRGRAQQLRREIDLALASDVQRRALMQLRRLHIHHAMRAIVRRAARLLDDERERIGLVQQAKLAVRALGVGRIREHAAAEEVAMEVGDERADVAHAQRLVIALEPAIAAHERLHGLVPELLVRIVDREIPAGSGMRMFGCDSRNSPMDGSSVKPCAPCPVVYTSIVLEP